MTTPSEPNNGRRSEPRAASQDGSGGSGGGAADAGYLLLLTKDDAGVNGFPAVPLPGNRILVRDLPFERLGGISEGEAALLPPPGSDLPVRRSRPTGSFAHRTSDDAPTVTAIVTLAGPVADVRIPAHLTSEKDFEDLLSRHGGDLHAGLVAEGMRASQFSASQPSASQAGADQAIARAPREITCAAPQITVGNQLQWSLCSWLGIFC